MKNVIKNVSYGCVLIIALSLTFDFVPVFALGHITTEERITHIEEQMKTPEETVDTFVRISYLAWTISNTVKYKPTCLEADLIKRVIQEDLGLMFEEQMDLKSYDFELHYVDVLVLPGGITLELHRKGVPYERSVAVSGEELEKLQQKAMQEIYIESIYLIIGEDKYAMSYKIADLAQCFELMEESE